MANILALETTGKFCSIAASIDGHTFKWTDDTENNHSAVLHQSILNLFSKNNIALESIEAIALSAGPGSYTGLRVGSSSAKGLCLALDIPLIGIPTHESMLFSDFVFNKYKYILCATDARREDVFASLYLNGTIKHGVEVLNVKELEWLENIPANEIAIMGSGAQKIKALNDYPQSFFVEKECLGAEQILKAAQQKYQKSLFEDLANYEPQYEKEFYSTQKIK